MYQMNLQRGSADDSVQDGLDKLQVFRPFLSGPGENGLPVETDQEDHNSGLSWTAPALLKDTVTLGDAVPWKTCKILSIFITKRLRRPGGFLLKLLVNHPVFQRLRQRSRKDLRIFEVMASCFNDDLFGTEPQVGQIMPWSA
jgi:hypothetical protein